MNLNYIAVTRLIAACVLVSVAMFGTFRAQGANRPDTQFVTTSVLNMAYEISGPVDGTPIILLHGFPDDVRAWDEVVAGITTAGFRAYVPYLRGFGQTTFLNAETVRSGQNAALVQDVIEFADALGLDKFVLVGHDWGAQAAQGVAALYPQRVIHLISFAPYSLTWSDYQQGAPDYEQIRALWYQNLLNEDLGEVVLNTDRRGFARYLWQTWSPSWAFSDQTFEVTAGSFDNPDFAAVVLHAYRSGYGAAIPDPRYADIETRLAQRPSIPVPTTVLLGKEDGINIFAPYMLEQSTDFTGEYTARAYDGVGHFIHRENPQAVIEAILDAARS
jgi:pimeloyl-ACP methyl ester carboxylesterase